MSDEIKRRTNRGKYPKKGDIRGKYTTHICKTCGKEFRRMSWGHSSKDYCTYRCEPAYIYRQIAAQVTQLAQTDEVVRNWLLTKLDQLEAGQEVTEHEVE